MSSPKLPLPVPFVLSTHGRAEIPHPAERAAIHVFVASSGTNKAAVSDDVVTTAQHIERLLRELSPPADDPTAEAKDAAPLAHWSKTGLSATSYVPHSQNGQIEARQYNARITFDIRFKKFKEMGGFGARLSALPHAEVSHIDWILTASTRKSYQSRLRKAAAGDALEKARDYCEVLGCGNLRPVELHEGSGGGGGFGTGTGGGLFGPNARLAQAAAASHQQMQAAPGNRTASLAGPGGGSGTEARDESPLEFTPKEVRMEMDVTVKFHAECVF